jgi:hypothetical protein
MKQGIVVYIWNLARVLVASSICTVTLAQIAPSPPPDRTQSIRAAQSATVDAAIAPFVAQARASYPAAKLRFLQGLPAGQMFFVTIQLQDAQSRSERVFLRVSEIHGSMIVGAIANDVVLVEGFKSGQSYPIDESEILDWLIAKPDGSEEGNFVGKFLDTYRP